MLATENLLHLSPEDALVEIVNYYNSTGIRYGTVTFESPQVIAGKQTRVKIKAKEGLMGNNNPVNSNHVTYHRIDLNEFLTLEDREMEIVLPGSTADIITQLVDKYGIVLAPNDFLIELIPDGATSFTLKAHPQSLRWYGTVVVNLTPALPDISVSLPVGVLPGLTNQPLDVWLKYLLWEDMLADIDYNPLMVDINGLRSQPHSFGFWYTVGGGDLVISATMSQTSAQMYETMLIELLGGVNMSGNYTVDPPVTLTGGTWNTRTVVHGKEDEMFTGTTVVDYNRFDLGVHIPNGIEIDHYGDTMLYDVVEYINTTYGTNISKVDDVTVVATPDGVNAIHVITAKSTSLGWIGTTTVTVNLVA